MKLPTSGENHALLIYLNSSVLESPVLLPMDDTSDMGETAQRNMLDNWTNGSEESY